MKKINQIWAYMCGKRNGREANRLEREALSDPFLFEAMQGVSTVEADHGRALKEMERRLEERAGRKNKWGMYRWVAAASFLLVAGFTAWMVSLQPEQEVTEQLATLQQADSVADVPVVAVLREAETIEQEKPERIRGRVRSRAVEQAAPVPSSAEIVEVLDSSSAGSRDENNGDVRARKANLDKAEADVTPTDSGQQISVARLLKNKMKHMKLVDNPRLKRRGLVERIGRPTWWEGLDRYVTDSIRLPEVVRMGTVEGEVRLSVKVDEQGHVSTVSVLKGLSPECDEEAVRLLKAYGGTLGEGSCQEERIVEMLFFKPSD